MKKILSICLCLALILVGGLSLAACGENPDGRYITIYENTDGDYTAWNEAPQATGLEPTTFEGEKVAAIKGNGKELDYDIVNDYTTENYNFTVTYDIYVITEKLNGTTVTGSNVVSVDVGLRNKTWQNYKPVFGAGSEGKVKVVFATDGDFTNGTEIDGDKWYTVKIRIESTDTQKTVKGQIIDRETGVVVIDSNVITLTNVEAECVYANIYFPGTANDEAMAYLDNFKIVAEKKA